MGTHNRAFRVDTPAFPSAFFEIIAIDPHAAAPDRTRWFDMDGEEMRELLASGPRLIHFVASTSDATAAVGSLRAEGIDRGRVLAAERPTPSGLLRWKITVRDDGRRLFGGALPTIIEWGGVHPCDHLRPSAIQLESLTVSHPEIARLRGAYQAIGLEGVALQEGQPALAALFGTPRGPVRLESVLSRD